MLVVYVFGYLLSLSQKSVYQSTYINLNYGINFLWVACYAHVSVILFFLLENLCCFVFKIKYISKCSSLCLFIFTHLVYLVLLCPLTECLGTHCFRSVCTSVCLPTFVSSDVCKVQCSYLVCFLLGPSTFR